MNRMEKNKSGDIKKDITALKLFLYNLLAKWC